MLNKELLVTPKESVELIRFYDDDWGIDSTSDIKLVAVKGMTWEELINSKYRPIFEQHGEGDYRSYALIGDSVARVGFYSLDNLENYYITSGVDYSVGGDRVLASDEIIDGYTYTWTPCYLKGTLITLSDGSKKSVETITYEDDLLVWDFDNRCFAIAKPLWIKKAQKTTYYYRLKFEDDTEICLVGQDGKCHRLFNIEKQEFISGTDFHVGEHTFSVEGKLVKLMSIEIVEDEVEYYNIITNYHMNCFANGLLTSTQYNNVYLIKDMKFVKDDRELIPFEAYEGISKKFYDGMRLGEQDLNIRSIEKTNQYIKRMLALML